ncbi:MAG: hypothetical protein AMXMBFR53_19030 [Gemmatimonadota bacterium]
MRIAILGGTGNAGRAVARLLLEHTDHDVRIFGRDAGRAAHVASSLRTGTGRDRVSSSAVAAPAELAGALAGHDILMVAAPVSADVAPWARVALEAGCDWLDLLLSVPAKHAALRALAAERPFAGRCLVTDGGVHPGLPGALVRLAAGRMQLRRARVAMRFGVDWGALDFAADTVAEFAQELGHYEARLYRDGRWVRGWRYASVFDFGPGVGRVGCAPMFMAELEEVQRALPNLRDVEFQVAGFGPLVDWVGMPAALLLQRLGADRAASRLLGGALRRFGRGSGPSVVLLEAEGPEGERLDLRLTCGDAYVLTAAPVVAAVRQWEEARRPGLHGQALFLDPERLLEDLPGLGVRVG